ncbi:hypothetical protein TorRG33x02_042530 [Trema orientale]|uniref:Uncharacterized protein n=1 Tax=Trema orientale TaxID=63057 RepID=A0A2P5FPV8_TREOI|nr:hypothetical protein TorRG33x02_042530 [Trema orientale]
MRSFIASINESSNYIEIDMLSDFIELTCYQILLSLQIRLQKIL